MSDYQLNKLLFKLAGQHTMVESFTDEAELAAYDLTPEEREALRQGDTDRLYALGANGYMIRRVFRRRFKL